MGGADIVRWVEEGVAAGEFPPGQRLPAVRQLADRFGVSPTTVASAYRQLRSRGVVVTRARSGTRVSHRPPLPVRSAPAIPAGVVDLASGNPDPSLLPNLDAALSSIDPRPRLYGGEATLPELAVVASQRLRQEGIDAQHLAVVSGALDGVERVLRAALRPGDRLAVEDPGYAGVIDLCRSLGFDLVPVSVDDQGPTPLSLQRALELDARAVIVTPRAQNPTGAALTEDRVVELRAVLETRPGVLVIEDDHAAEVSGASARTLASGRDRWATIRSVSKSFGPDMRTAVLVGDSTTLRHVEGMQHLGAGWVSHILQRLAAAIWQDPAVADSVLEEAGRAYTARRDALLAALADDNVHARGRSGLNVWVPVDDEAGVVQGLFQRGWLVRGGQAYRLESPPAVRITVAGLRNNEIIDFADAMGEVLSGPHRTRAG